MVEIEINFNPPASPVRGVAEKKEEFLLWLKKRQANERNSPQEQPPQTDPAQWRAMMVWIDDGGRVG